MYSRRNYANRPASGLPFGDVAKRLILRIPFLKNSFLLGKKFFHVNFVRFTRRKNYGVETIGNVE